MNADFEQIQPGQSARATDRVTQAHIQAFADVSGDTNPVHLDEDYAKATAFGGVIAHGMLSAAFISKVLGTQLPGHGAIYVEQSLRFRAPVRPGDEVVTDVEVIEVLHSKKRVRLRTTCSVEGRKVLDGEALMLVP